MDKGLNATNNNCFIMGSQGSGYVDLNSIFGFYKLKLERAQPLEIDVFKKIIK